MVQLFVPPYQTTLDANANAVSGARLTFYASGTTTPVPVYADAALTTALTSPVIADSAGRFVPIYLDPTIRYRVIVADASGSPIRDVDPIGDSTIADLADGGGLALIGFQQLGTGTVLRTALSKARELFSVADWGAVGDGEEDDTAAIQAGLDWLGANGGGTLTLPKPPAYYRITEGLRIPSYVTLEGQCKAARYPFNAGATGSIAIVADFTDPFQWMIDSATTDDGDPIPYNTALSPALPTGATFNCGVRDLMLINKAGNADVYGGVRMQGCPGARVEVAVGPGISCGVFVNCAFDAEIKVHTLTKNYGVIGYNINACVIDIYDTGTDPTVKTVASGYVPALIGGLNGFIVDVLKLTTEAHATRKWALILSSNDSTSTGNTIIHRCSEKRSGHIFMRYAYGTTILGPYMEGADGETDFGIVASNSHYVATGAHAFFDGDGALLDHGIDTTAEIHISGIPFYNTFGTVFREPASRTTIRQKPPTVGPAIPQYNINHPDFDGDAMVPTSYTNGWSETTGGGVYETVSYVRRRDNFVVLQGRLTGGTSGQAAFTFPAGYRPNKARDYAAVGGSIRILANGQLIPTLASGETEISLEGISYPPVTP